MKWRGGGGIYRVRVSSEHEKEEGGVMDGGDSWKLSRSKGAI